MAGLFRGSSNLATFAPPARTTFQNVNAAADDRTFVVFAVTVSRGSVFSPGNGTTLSGRWYAVRITPGAHTTVHLSRLPIQPWSWAGGGFNVSAAGQVAAMALSASGRQLAVAGLPRVSAADQPQDWQEVKVYSVRTGQLLHDWTEHDPDARLATVLTGTLASVPTGNSALTWVGRDSALTLATSYDAASKVTGTIRRVDVTGPDPDSLLTNSTVIWSGALSWNDKASCLAISAWPPQIPVSASWVSPSGGSLIVERAPGKTGAPAEQAYFGVVSHGRFSPLGLPAGMAGPLVLDVTF